MAWDTADDAAAAALAKIREQKHAGSREYIGLIYQDPDTGKFLFTDPQTQSGRKSRGKAKGTFAIPKGSLAGIIHNHPGNPNREDLASLSADDVAMARQLGVASYIGVGDNLLRWTGETRGRGTRERGTTQGVLSQIDMSTLPERRGILAARN